MKNVLFILTTLFLISCANNKEELPSPDEEPVVTGPLITYTQHTKQIFDNYCITCHAPMLSQANFPLTTYQEVTANTYANIGGLIETRVLIQKNMPPTGSAAGQPTQAELDTLQMWLNQGAQQ